jgi:two-component system, OmpR family, osmolarity sensor histidine kinase EnvZ
MIANEQDKAKKIRRLQKAAQLYSDKPAPLRLLSGWISQRMPKRLYARSLIIIILPMVILQSVVTFLFMERHWQAVTQRLSTAVSRDIAAIVTMTETPPLKGDFAFVTKIAAQNLNLDVKFLPPAVLPKPMPYSSWNVFHNILTDEIHKHIPQSFWVDTVTKPKVVEIRVQLTHHIVQLFVMRNQAYASNAHIFLLWMFGTSLVLLSIAILFLRNQIRPIQQLAEAAESFGKGRAMPRNFRPRGAEEVRRAGLAFIQMRERIERQIEQRTAMLTGVSHDLRTILTRFKLQLVLLPAKIDKSALEADVVDMQSMLEAYMAFARGEAGEETGVLDLEKLFEKLEEEASLHACVLTSQFLGAPLVYVRAHAFTRLLNNLVNNAFKNANKISINGTHDRGWLTIIIDDNGPGIPPESREDVFRPFVRLDEARNQDESGTGLGLAIARDIVRSHGGTIMLSESEWGGLRATVRVPA